MREPRIAPGEPFSYLTHEQPCAEAHRVSKRARALGENRRTTDADHRTPMHARWQDRLPPNEPDRIAGQSRRARAHARLWLVERGAPSPRPVPVVPGDRAQRV